MLRVIAFSLLVSSALCLNCYTCDNDCAEDTRVIGCPDGHQCYTVSNSRGYVFRKGCVRSCVDEVAESVLMCSLCATERCNDAVSVVGIGHGGQPMNASPLPPNNGGGNNGIGHGAEPTKTSNSLMLWTPVVALFTKFAF